jgi:hypothetical protein
MNKVEFTNNYTEDLAECGDVYEDGSSTLLVYSHNETRLWAIRLETGKLWKSYLFGTMPITDALRTYGFRRVSPGTKLTLTVGVKHELPSLD